MIAMYLKLPAAQRSFTIPGYAKLPGKPGRKFFLLLTIILLPAFLFAQRLVTGKVTDENALPLSGVSVRISGTQSGVTTNSDGVFTIRASKGQVLEISYIGMLDEKITVGNS